MMNNERRKALKVLRNKIDEIHRALSDFDLESLKEDLDNILSDEQEAFDNMPESLQESDRGQATQEAINQLEGALEHLETVAEVLQELENAVGCIETAAE